VVKVGDLSPKIYNDLLVTKLLDWFSLYQQGDLMQLLLIQTQVMKVDMESALLQMDQLMRANRLNFSLMAGLPALLAVFSLFSLGSTSLGTSSPDASANHSRLPISCELIETFQRSQPQSKCR